MVVGFPLYAVHTLHHPAHTSGYLWAAVAAGSIIGTFAFTGAPALRRVGFSYAILGVSALLWPLAGTLLVGIALIGLTGILEGPAYSGSIALRQRYAPPMLRAQVTTTVSGIVSLALSAGAALGGAIHAATALILCLVGVNLVAAAWSLALDRVTAPSAR